jgi:hypothetical protein
MNGEMIKSDAGCVDEVTGARQPVLRWKPA